ncbi:hypothetical protein D3C72_2299000 [compost metagenome]
MNALRSSPLSALLLASLLHSVIFSCCVTGAAGVAFRQVLMNALRSSPLSALVLASLLQLVILSCCAVAANPCVHTSNPSTSSGIRSIPMAFSPCSPR